jgi:hypothetical protein
MDRIEHFDTSINKTAGTANTYGIAANNTLPIQLMNNPHLVHYVAQAADGLVVGEVGARGESFDFFAGDDEAAFDFFYVPGIFLIFDRQYRHVIFRFRSGFNVSFVLNRFFYGV